MNDQEFLREREKMRGFADELARMAQKRAMELGIDPASTAMSLGFAATRILFGLAKGDPGAAFRAAGIFSEASVKSMADMVAGADSGNQTTQ